VPLCATTRHGPASTGAPPTSSLPSSPEQPASTQPRRACPGRPPQARTGRKADASSSRLSYLGSNLTFRDAIGAGTVRL
jgi:hypothetical protein